MMDVILQNIMIIKLKPEPRVNPKEFIKMVVKKEGPAPRAALIIRLAAVKAAPLISGGLTLILNGKW